MTKYSGLCRVNPANVHKKMSGFAGVIRYTVSMKLSEQDILRIVMKSRDRIAAAAWVVVRDAHAAEDIFQNVAIKTLKKIDGHPGYELQGDGAQAVFPGSVHPETGEQYAECDYSDTLLIFLLKGNRPEKYRERLNVQHEGGVKILELPAKPKRDKT